MSCDIRRYGNLHLTAFVGPTGDRFKIQFTIDGKYESLGEKQLLDLIKTICSRLMVEDGYSATGIERENIDYEDER